MSSRATIGLDIGYGAVKAVSSDGRQVSFPSAAWKFEIVDSYMHQMPEHVRTSRGVYAIGDDARKFGRGREMTPPESDHTWFMDDLFRALAVHALGKLGARQADLVLGLPMDDCRKYKAQLTDTVQGWNSSEAGLSLRVIDVIPQPMGTFFDVAYDPAADGFKPEFEKHVAIIDIGSGTIDCMEVLEGTLSWVSKGQANKGIHTAYDEIYAHLFEKLKLTELQKTALPEIVRAGEVTVRGKKVSLAKVIESAKTNLLTKARIEAAKYWGDMAQVDRIVFTGGGAEFLREQIAERFPAEQVTIPPVPAMANARGYLKFAQFERAAEPA